ncbi:MAG: YggS family pyridoxal phosphate-dependent enzyme [Lachnospiraceae bacterium]|nr:YggS family pyridoxal phosphate-dependent enzyme [Lachnospiraceae bacterium]
MIAENLRIVEEKIEAACRRAGRERPSVTLIAVSKTKPLEAVLEAAAAGQKDFGENKAQELKAKQDEIPASLGLRWHFIGNLQKNKVKYLVGRNILIHSVSSAELAHEIERLSEKREVITEVLAEVNIADEATKHGVDREGALALLTEMATLPHLHLRGLMAIAPPVEDPEENRKYFIALRELMDQVNASGLFPHPLTELSMGMSGDYEVAIEEGATFVRVGTAIFGERNYAI